ncbi:MAG: SprT family zinc-dependent metalloprotease [Cyanobacteria bacterium MAG CAR4_bin_6]|nr:SprT family zinc-dependent metalloprotease [Cyanobacteria bacterium MAG CAR4_bin_6]
MGVAFLPPLFHRYNQAFFARTIPHDQLRFSWSRRMSRAAGSYRHRGSLARITLSLPVLSPLPASATHSTLVHEMIHAWVDLVLHRREGHGPCFCSKMEEINSRKTGLTVGIRHHFPVPARPASWQARCGCCGAVTPYKRRVTGLACRTCCRRFNGGRWDQRFLLRFERHPANAQDQGSWG